MLVARGSRKSQFRNSQNLRHHKRSAIMKRAHNKSDGIRRAGPYGGALTVPSIGKVQRDVPPHPSPLPQGEGWGEREEATHPQVNGRTVKMRPPYGCWIHRVCQPALGLILILFVLPFAAHAEKRNGSSSWSPSIVTLEVARKQYDYYQPWSKPKRQVQ